MDQMSRREVLALSAAGAIMAVGSAALAAEDPKGVLDLSKQKWDCLVNKTGKTLLVTLVSGNGTGGPFYLLDGASLPFKVRDTTKSMVFVAYEYGTDTLVRMEEFTVLHQNYPPTLCLHITKDKSARHEERAMEKDSPPATLTPF